MHVSEGLKLCTTQSSIYVRLPRWLSLVEQRFRKPSVAGSKPARGFLGDEGTSNGRQSSGNIYLLIVVRGGEWRGEKERKDDFPFWRVSKE